MEAMSNSSILMFTWVWLPVIKVYVGCLGLISVRRGPQARSENGASVTRE